VGKCPLQKKWSEQQSTPKKLEWAVVHSKILKFLEWNFVYSNFFGVEFECTKFFGVDFKCIPKILEWT
jgi:hypothetical protein